MPNLSESTMKWLVTTLASWVLVVIFVLANLKEPLLAIDGNIAFLLLVAGLAGLGITNVGAYNAVKTNEQVTTSEKLAVELDKRRHQ